VPPGTRVPPDKLAMDILARIMRDVSDREREYIRFAVKNYLRLNRRRATGCYPSWND